MSIFWTSKNIFKIYRLKLCKLIPSLRTLLNKKVFLLFVINNVNELIITTVNYIFLKLVLRPVQFSPLPFYLTIAILGKLEILCTQTTLYIYIYIYMLSTNWRIFQIEEHSFVCPLYLTRWISLPVDPFN